MNVGSGSRVAEGVSFISGESVDDPDSGHGTHCAGTVGGNTYGVAAGVTIIPIKVLSNAGSGSNFGIIKGMRWARDDCAGGLCVMSMSLGGGISTSLDDAVNEIVLDSEIPVVVAAGNDGDDAMNYSPARALHAITVGNVKKNLRLSFSSNWGSAIDIFAPGTDVTSTYAAGTTATISGTSMACPHVAGLVAQILQRKGHLTPAEIMTELQGDYGVEGHLVGDLKDSVNLFAHISDDSSSEPVSTTEPIELPAECDETHVTLMTDNYAHEISWWLTGNMADGTPFHCSGDGYEASRNEYTHDECCVPLDSTWTLSCYDEYGDGWQYRAVDGYIEIHGEKYCEGDFGSMMTVDYPPAPAGLFASLNAQSLIATATSENVILNGFAMVGLISTLAFFYRRATNTKVYTEVADIEEEY